MSNTLFLNQNYVNVGLGTMTYTVPTGGDGLYNVKVQVTVPQADPVGDGAGSGTGLGSGAGGGDAAGFARGGLGAGLGGVGQSLGNNSGYQQPPVAGSNETLGAAVSSSLSIVVNKNGSPIYTAPAIRFAQSAEQFKTFFLAAATDVITVVMSSSDPDDLQLNSVKSNISIGQGVA